MATVGLLSTGYWHVRWSLNQFAQWPKGGLCTLADVFPRGWATEKMVEEANSAAASKQGETR